MSTTTPPTGAKSSDTASSASMVPKTSRRENFSSRAGSSTKIVSPSSCCPYAVRPIVTSSSVQPTQRCSSVYRSSSGTRLTGESGLGVQGAPDFVDAFLQRGHVAIVVDDEIRPSALELGRHLGGDHVHGLGLSQCSLPREPLEAKRTRRVDEDDPIEIVDQSPLEEQRDVANDGFVAAFPCLVDQIVAETGDFRMHDRVQHLELGWLLEDDLAKSNAIQTPVRLEDIVSPALHDLAMAIAA